MVTRLPISSADSAGTLTGTENIPAARGSTPVRMTPETLAAYTAANASALTAIASGLRLSDIPNVRREGGATGDGVTNDTAAVQATINLWTDQGGGPIFIPPGVYKINSTINCLKGTRILGSGMSSLRVVANDVCILDATANLTTTAVKWPGNSANGGIEDIYIKGPDRTLVTAVEFGGSFGGSTGIDCGYSGSRFFAKSVYMTGFSNQLTCQYLSGATFVNMWCDFAKTHALSIYAGTELHFIGSLFSNAAANGSTQNPANIYIGDGAVNETYGITFNCPLVDEAFGSGASIYVKGGSDIAINNAKVFLTHAGYGVRIGANANRVTLNNVRVVPFVAPGHIPTNTIKIEGGTDHRMINVTTDANGGGDISDAGTATLYMNVNGRFVFPSLPTSEPAKVGELWRNGEVVTTSNGL